MKQAVAKDIPVAASDVGFSSSTLKLYADWGGQYAAGDAFCLLGTGVRMAGKCLACSLI
jgi:hypothetical protein